MPTQSDGDASKAPDRIPPGDGGEKLVSRDEAPVDVNSKSGPSLVVFLPLNHNSSPPPVASVSPTGPALTTAANGTMQNNEPRKIKVLAMKGDPAENGGSRRVSRTRKTGPGCPIGVRPDCSGPA